MFGSYGSIQESEDEAQRLLYLDEKAEYGVPKSNARPDLLFGWISYKILPFILVAKLIVVAAVAGVVYLKTTSVERPGGHSNEISSALSDASCHECPDMIAAADCTNPKYPVLGGLDVVQYFSFTNESQIGVAGSSDYQATYNQYVFYFTSKSNQEEFESDSERYVPQFGGFCSWGISGEFCPKFFWTSTCLGPDANWGIWTIHKDKLYFFYLQTAKDLFLEDPDFYAAQGAERWSTWFPNGDDQVFNTQCFYNTTEGFIDTGMQNRTLPDGAPTQDKAEESAESTK